MPRKERAARPTRAERLPSFDTWNKLRRDFGSPVGTWNMDAAITAIVSKGICKYPPDDWSPDPKHPLIRPILRDAAMNALVGAWSVARGMENNASAKRRINLFCKLHHHLALVMSDISTEAKSLLSVGFPPDSAETTIAVRASELRELLAVLIQERADRSPAGGNSDYLSRDFILHMRGCWRLLTETEPPRGGGQLLIKLAVGTWRDAAFPIAFDEKERPLEDWMAERFRNLDFAPSK